MRRCLCLLGVLLALMAGCGESDAEELGLGELTEAVVSAVAIEPSEALATFEGQIAIANDFTARCMREAGFDWMPVPPPIGGMLAGEPGDPPRGTREWAETYGLGITTRRFSRELVGPGLVGVTGEPGAFVDPNATYVQTLTAEGQASYRRTLQGDGGDDLGCQGRPWVEVDELRAGTAIRTSFQTELAEIAVAAFAVPEVVEAEEALTLCVAAQGLPSMDPDDLEAELSAMTSLAQQESDAGSDALSREASDALARAQELEISFALAVHDCREQVGYDAVIDAAYRSQLEIFVSERGGDIQEVLAG